MRTRAILTGLAAFVASVTMTACGSESPDPGAAPSAAAWGGHEDGAAACDLLGTGDLESVTGASWSVASDEWSRCQFATGTDTLDVEVLPFDAYDGLQGVAERDGVKVLEWDGHIVEVWMQAGGPRYEDDFLTATVGLRHTTGLVSDDDLIALAETAAINHENLDPEAFKADGVPLGADAGNADGDAGDGGDGGGSNAGGGESAPPGIVWTSALTSVRLDGVVGSTGNTFSIEVTSDDVVDSGNPAATMIYCIGGVPDQSEGLVWEGQYIVQANDQRVTDGVRDAELTADEDVDGPGEYAAHLYIAEADGDTFNLPGHMTIDAGMLGGTYVMDADGTPVTGTWECRT